MNIKIGCLGAARVASTALCNPANTIGGVELHAIAARVRERAEAFGIQHGFRHIHDTYDEVVDDEANTLIYNPLPVHLHAEWTIRALRSGKHVLCEKPFAMNFQEAKSMVAAAKANQRRVIEAFHYRYHPAFATLLDWVKSGRIGQIKKIKASFTAPIDNRSGAEIRHLPETGGGAFMDLGCYPLNWARQVLGSEPEAFGATAVCTHRGVDESLMADLVFPCGAEAHLHASMALDQPRSNRLEVIGRDGRIVFENPLAPHLGAHLFLETATEQKTAIISRVSTYTYQLVAVIEALESGSRLPTEGDELLGQQAALDAIYSAAKLAHLRQT